VAKQLVAEPVLTGRERRKFRLGTVCPPEEDRTRQEDADSADINLILSRMGQGLVPQQRVDGVYEDVSGVGDLQACLETVRRGNELFSQLAVQTRNAFDNDPVKYVAAFETPEGLEKLAELGVIERKPDAAAVAAADRQAAIERAVALDAARDEARAVRKAKREL